MLTGLVLTAALVGPAFAGSALAQSYPAATEAPHTTDPARLRVLATQREIHERFARGLQAESRADWAAAVPEFERIIALDPPEPAGSTARYDLAIARARSGGYQAAATLLESALELDPGFTAAAANLVIVEVMAGDAAAARTAADRLVALAPASARARYERGIVALRSDDLALARADFRALLAGDPAYAVAHYDLAIVEVRGAQFDAAELELDRALAIDPRYARARFALATVYVRTGRRADARAAFDRAAHDASDVTLRTLALELRDRL